MDSENILQLLNKYSQGITSQDEENLLLDFLENNPNAISEEGYDMLIDKLVYERSLLQRKEMFKEMMKTPPTSFFKTNFWPIIVSSIVLVIGVLFFVVNNLNSDNNRLSHDNKVSIDSIATENTNKVEEKKVLNKSENQSNSVENSISPQNNIFPSDNSNLNSTKNSIQNASEINQSSVTGKAVNENAFVTKNEVVQKENVKQLSIINDCPDYSKLISVKTSKSEINQNNGTIRVITSSTNVQYSIDNDNFSYNKLFENLSPGKYTLYIVDNAKCSNTISNIVVNETTCITEYSKDLTIGESWQIPIMQSDVKSIVIYNKSGQIVYKQNQIYSNEFEWKGINNEGNLLQVGLYKVVIVYSKESCIFNVSILD